MTESCEIFLNLQTTRSVTQEHLNTSMEMYKYFSVKQVFLQTQKLHDIQCFPILGLVCPKQIRIRE